jgi:hypothetical protein
LANLIQQPPKFRPDRLIHGRKKFSDDQPTTAFPGYLRKLELEVFRPELTDGQKLELLRASVTGEHAVTLAEALEDAAVTFATHYPATESSRHTMKSPVKGRSLTTSFVYTPLYDDIRTMAIHAILGDDALSDMEHVLHQVKQGRSQSVELYNRAFKRALDQYITAGGPPAMSNSHSYRKMYRRDFAKE